MVEYGVCALIINEKPCVLDRFYRAGGEDAPATRVESIISCNNEELVVKFFIPAVNMDYHPVSRKSGLENPAFQHSIAIQIRPDWDNTAVYYFASASSGEDFGLFYNAVPLSDDKKPEEAKGYYFEKNIIDDKCVWLSRIPWEVIGGKPDSSFGMNIFYTFAQNSEYLSPVAMDHTRGIAPDLMMEVAFGDTPTVVTLPGIIVDLPSGVSRWQRPAVLKWPDNHDRQNIWRLQQQLIENTTPDTLNERIKLCQCWLDLLVLEGFSFHTEGGCWNICKDEYRPEMARTAINEALRKGETARACMVLDTFLHQLDRASREWFADDSPGNVTNNWQELKEITAIECRENIVIMTCVAGTRITNLFLTSPQIGCLRLHADYKGFFDAEPDGKFIYSNDGGHITAKCGNLKIDIYQSPWSIVVIDNGVEKFSLSRKNLAFLIDKNDEIYAVDICKKIIDNERIYGFGERFDAVSQCGRIITIHDLDAWEGNIYGLRNQQYKPIQMFHSTAGYSCFINSTYRLRVDAGNSDKNLLRMTQSGEIFDIYLWFGEPTDAVKGYTDITGKPVLPPKWAFEPWMGGGWGRWKNGPLNDSVSEMLNVAERFENMDIPHTAIYAEGEGSSDPRLFTGLLPKNIRPLTWMNSNMNLNLQKKLLPDVPEDDLPVLHRADGTVFPYVDFTHPHALDLLRAYWQNYLDLGIAGTMVDFGDLVPGNATFHDGRHGEKLHNLYAYDYHRLYYQLFFERRGDDHIMFSRSAAPGSQRWLGQFAGDHQANFVGLTAALYGGLNLSVCGFSVWGCDIGGYMGWPDCETYIRWVQWGCFSPIMRCHGTEPREPWEFGDTAVNIYKYYAWLRENLLDYIYAFAIASHETGIPMMRPLPFAFPTDDTVVDCDDEYLFGPDLLVAPIHAAGNLRDILLPVGRWVDFWTGEVINGPANFKVHSPLDKIPLYLRAGAKVPVHLNSNLKWGESMTNNRIKVMVVTKPETGDFIVEIDNSDTSYMIVLGADVSVITVNNREVPLLDDDDIKACPPGWCVDGARVIVRLPAGINRIVEIFPKEEKDE